MAKSAQTAKAVGRRKQGKKSSNDASHRIKHKSLDVKRKALRLAVLKRYQEQVDSREKATKSVRPGLGDFVGRFRNSLYCTPYGVCISTSDQRRCLPLGKAAMARSESVGTNRIIRPANAMVNKACSAWTTIPLSHSTIASSGEAWIHGQVRSTDSRVRPTQSTFSASCSRVLNGPSGVSKFSRSVAKQLRQRHQQRGRPERDADPC